jgi:hydrogenase maturation protein HypF
MGSGAEGEEVKGVAVPPRARDAVAARYIELTGIVQGVGFRPFVYNLAVAHGLHGWVRNTSAGVQVHVEGQPEALDAFVRGLTTQAPPLARIETVTVSDRSPAGYKGFAIVESLKQEGAYQLVSSDIATCPDCLHELFDPADRRYAYPFTNCTNCGPRFTIIEDIPYDRPNTTMRAFRMCPQCQAEYENPANRRFHAQPNACPVCGPHLGLVDQTGAVVATLVAQSSQGTTHAITTDSGVLREASRLLQEGAILALKGLGGFHLACDATNQEAVRRLRERKHRPYKPFAVMVATLDEVERHCAVTAAEASLLASPSSPIVLLRWRDGSTIVRDVAPNNLYLGVMLPYTPLHHLLLREVGRPLVMTSGNLSEEPIAKDNEEALQRLAPLADAFLLHNRGIHARYDDSVWFVPAPHTPPTPRGAVPQRTRDAPQEGIVTVAIAATRDGVPILDEPQPIRRARGYAPQPVRLGFPMKRILACGAELKNTFCLTQERYALVSQHIGDLENLETLEHFVAAVQLYEHLFRSTPAAIACDLHPDYLATRYAEQRAREQGLPLYPIQHHHAHIASCLADNDWSPAGGPVIGVAMDGTGLGTDGHIWGGEFLIADYRSFERKGHLQYLPLPGGDAATRNPYRIALAYLYRCLGEIPALPFLTSVPQEEIQIVRQMVDQGINTPLTSSCGRLFDAVSALLGVCLEASYEAQAAIELEMIVGDVTEDASKPYPFGMEKNDGEHVVLLEPLFAGLVRDLRSSTPVPIIGAAFHRTMAEIIAHMCELIRKDTGLDTVALSGGCFQNRQLLCLAVQQLQARGFQVLLHRQVPCNDGGLSLGQAVIAHFDLTRSG